MKELKKIFDDIAAATTVKLSVYTEGGERVYGEAASYDFPEDGEGIYSDEKNGVTVFKFVCSSEEYLGVIGAFGDEGKNYAAMLLKIIEGALSSRSRITKREYLKRILFGEATEDEANSFRERYSFPLGGCYAIAVYSEKHIKEIENLLTHAAVSRADCVLHVDENDCALIKFTSEDGDYQSAAEYSEFLAGSIFEEIGVHPIIGVGGEAPSFSKISISFGQAFTAVKMCKTFSSKGDVHTYKEYLLTKMFDGVSDAKKQEYISEFISEGTEELFSDDEMMNTAEEFLSSSLNVSETSRNLYMHRNTLMYRLDKIEKATGLNIRKFSDAVSFRVLTILYTLLKTGDKD